MGKGVFIVVFLMFMLLFSTATQLHFVNSQTTPSSNITASATTWNKNFQGSGNVAVSALINTTDGGYAIAGSVNGTAAFIIKTDHNGAEQWSKTYEGLGFILVSSILQTSDGGYVLAGGTASHQIKNGSDCFFWLVKTDLSGSALWNRTYGQANTSGAYSAIQASDGGFVMVGSEAWGNQTDTAALMIKVNSSGNIEWNQTYASPGSGWAYTSSVVQVGDGGYALAGTASPTGEMAQNYWLIKTDSDGKAEWNQTYYPQNSSGGAGGPLILKNSNGGYTMAGYTGSLFATSVWILNISSNGTVLWDSTLPQTSAQPLLQTGFMQTGDDGFVVTGYAASLDGFNGLQSYLFMFKLASDGNLQWQRTYSTLTDANSALYAVQTIDGNYVLAGTMLSNTTGFETVWFAKVDSTGSTTTPTSNQTLTLQPAAVANGSVTGPNVSGNITSDTTWTLAGSPYNLTGDVEINSGVTLTIEAGSAVNLNSYNMQVNGTLTAKGTPANPIRIDKNLYPMMPPPQTVGIIFNPSSTAWNNKTETGSIIQNAIGNNLTILTNNASPTITQTSGFNVEVNGGSPIITSNTPSSIIVNGGSPTITNNTIEGYLGNEPGGGNFGLYLSGSNTAIVSDNSFYGGFYVQGAIVAASGTPTIKNNLIFGNPNNTVYSGVGIAVYSASPLIENNTFTKLLIGLNIYYDSQSSPSSSTPSPTIINNNFENNSLYNICLGSYPYIYGLIASNVNASYNWWGTTDTQAINQSICDFKNNPSLGTVTFTPFLVSPNLQALPISANIINSTPTTSPSPAVPELPSWTILSFLIVAATTALAYAKKREKQLSKVFSAFTPVLKSKT